jgi:hypothetical protein
MSHYKTELVPDSCSAPKLSLQFFLHFIRSSSIREACRTCNKSHFIRSRILSDNLIKSVRRNLSLQFLVHLDEACSDTINSRVAGVLFNCDESVDVVCLSLCLELELREVVGRGARSRGEIRALGDKCRREKNVSGRKCVKMARDAIVLCCETTTINRPSANAGKQSPLSPIRCRHYTVSDVIVVST